MKNKKLIFLLLLVISFMACKKKEDLTAPEKGFINLELEAIFFDDHDLCTITCNINANASFNYVIFECSLDPMFREIYFEDEVFYYKPEIHFEPLKNRVYYIRCRVETEYSSCVSNVQSFTTDFIPKNIIVYTASESLEDKFSDEFSSSFVMHTFNDGVGRIKFDDDVVSIESKAFADCTSLTSVKMYGKCFTSIDDGAFVRCINLTYIDIHNDVESIGNNAFNWCKKLTSITIPSNVRSIGYYAFYNCPLESIGCYADTPPACASDPFNNDVYKKATLWVPEKSVNLYKRAAVWGKFKKIW